MSSLILGIIVGMIAGIPLGPIGATALGFALNRKAKSAMGIGAGASLALGFYGFVSIALFEKAKGLIEQHANLLQIAVAVVFGAMALKGLLAVKGDAALSAVSNEAQMVSLNKNVSLNENVALNDRFGASFLSGSGTYCRRNTKRSVCKRKWQPCSSVAKGTKSMGVCCFGFSSESCLVCCVGCFCELA